MPPMMERFSLMRELSLIQDPVIHEKLHQLRLALSQYNIELRDDSRLALSWALNKLPPPWTMRRVVRELVFLHYLYLHTDYQQRLEVALPLVKNFLRMHSNMTSDQIHLHVHQFVIPSIRWQTLLDHGICDSLLGVLAQPARMDVATCN